VIAQKVVVVDVALVVADRHITLRLPERIRARFPRARR
jgi:hypothetical protein